MVGKEKASFSQGSGPAKLEARLEAVAVRVRCGSAPLLGCGIWQVSLDFSSSRFQDEKSCLPGL